MIYRYEDVEGVKRDSKDFTDRLRGLHWSCKPSHTIVDHYGAIYQAHPSYEDDDGVMQPEQKVFRFAGCNNLDMGRSYRLPSLCDEDALRARNILITAHEKERRKL